MPHPHRLPLLLLLRLRWLLPLLLAGCSAVTSRTPIAATTAPELRDDLRGIWRSDDGVFTIEFTPAGLGIMAGLDWKDESRFEKNEMEFVAAGRNEWLFLSGRDRGEPDKGYYLGAYRIAEPDHLVFWNPKPGAFAALVESGQLPGSVQRGSHSLSVHVEDGARLFQALDQPEALFDLAKPLVFSRVIAPDRNRGQPPGGDGESSGGQP